jgi:hypothetical protein
MILNNLNLALCQEAVMYVNFDILIFGLVVQQEDPSLPIFALS